MKKMLALVATVLSVHAMAELWLDPATSIEWQYTIQGREATITSGRDSTSAIPPATAGDLVLPASITDHTVTQIGPYAFFGCTNLTGVTIPESVTRIGKFAFRGCVNLARVAIPISVTLIGPFAFCDCDSLEAFQVAEGNPNYQAVAGLLLTKDGKTLVSGVNGLAAIPEGVTEISDAAFSGRGSLLGVSVPASVTRLGSFAFKDCCDLRAVRLHGEKPDAPRDSFQGCGKLEAVHVPASAQSWAGMQDWLGLALVVDEEPHAADPESAYLEDMPLDKVKALAEAGDAAAMCELGSRYRRGVDVPINPDEAAKWTAKAAALGHARAQALCSSLGYGVEKNAQEAVALYRKAAAKGDRCAMNNLGLCYETGDGVEKNAQVAVAWVWLAADNGLGIAMMNLSRFYMNGFGVGKDEKTALAWARQAAEKGDAAGMYALGYCSATGRGVEKNEAEAIKWYRQAAEKGHTKAMITLGYCSAKGDLGVEKDEAEAVKWYRQAAERGNAEAMGYLGARYATGQGVEKDEAEAVKWYRQAADRGNATAMHYLGYCYANGGLGVEKDEDEATTWFRKAADSETRDLTLQYYVVDDAVILGQRLPPPAEQGQGRLSLRERRTLRERRGPVRYNNGSMTVKVVSGALVIPDVIDGKPVRGISDPEFTDCRGLKSITIPASVTEIGEGAFIVRHDELRSFAVDAANPAYSARNGLLCTKDGSTLIAGVDGDVTIPASVTSIGREAFYSCSERRAIQVEDGNPCYKAVSGLLVTKDGQTLVLGVNGEVAIPSGVTSIAESAFADCRELASVTIPDSVTNIGDWAFADCKRLTEVTIPSSVTSIGRGAFSGCKSLTRVTIPGSVKAINTQAFESCSELAEVTMLGEKPNVGKMRGIPDNIFHDCAKLKTIHVPAAAQSWAEMLDWFGIDLVFDGESEADRQQREARRQQREAERQKLEAEIKAKREAARQQREADRAKRAAEVKAKLEADRAKLEADRAKLEADRAKLEADRQKLKAEFKAKLEADRAKREAERQQREADRAEMRRQLAAMQEEMRKAKEERAKASQAD